MQQMQQRNINAFHTHLGSSSVAMVGGSYVPAKWLAVPCSSFVEAVDIYLKARAAEVPAFITDEKGEKILE